MPIKDTFLAGILAHVPEADRGKVETAIEGLEANGLRQSEFSKLSDEAAAAKKAFDAKLAENIAWYNDRKAALGEVDTLRAENAELKAKGNGTGEGEHDKPFKLPEGLVYKKDVEELERGAVGFIAEANVLALKHYKDFNEILNITDLMKDPRVQQIGIQGVYADKFKDQIAAKAKAAKDASDEALRKEGYEKARAEQANQHHPYPVVGNEPSVLDGIEAARAGKQVAARSVDEMAAEFARLNAVRAGAS